MIINIDFKKIVKYETNYFNYNCRKNVLNTDYTYLFIPQNK